MKNIFFKSTAILLIGGLITRIIGFVIRVYYTRVIGDGGIELFAIVMPTYSLLVSIATFTLPISISKLVAEGKKRSISIMQNAVFIIMFINFFVILFMIFSSDFIATYLLNQSDCKYILIAMSLSLPFISLSSIIKGYFLGKQRTMPYMISNVLEQVFRLILIFLFLPPIAKLSPLYAVSSLMLLTIFSETFSIIIFLFFLPKNVVIKKNDLLFNHSISSDILSLSIPSTSSRLIGNIGYFFEPIILTNILIFCGYSNHYVISNYAAFNAYAIPILTVPAFFIQALSQTLIPEVSKYMELGNLKFVRKRVRQVLIFTFVLGLLFSIFILIFHEKILLILYYTTSGSIFIKVLAPIFAFFYLEGIMYSVLQAVNKANVAFLISFKGTIVKLVSLIIFCFLNVGIYALVISSIINIVYIIFTSFKILKKNMLI